jgi:hypothetical protein
LPPAFLSAGGAEAAGAADDGEGVSTHEAQLVSVSG